jgi:hypothetical protein
MVPKDTAGHETFVAKSIEGILVYTLLILFAGRHFFRLCNTEPIAASVGNNRFNTVKRFFGFRLKYNTLPARILFSGIWPRSHLTIEYSSCRHFDCQFFTPLPNGTIIDYKD